MGKLVKVCLPGRHRGPFRQRRFRRPCL